MGSTLDALSLQRRFLSDLGSNFDDFGMIFARFGKLFGINKNDSGTNRSKNKLWGKSFHRQSLGQIVPKTTSGTNRFQNNHSGAIRYTPYGIHYTPDATNDLWDKSFQKQALGQIVPKTYSGTNRSTKQKTIQQILPTMPSQKKGAGRSPRLAARSAVIPSRNVQACEIMWTK